jgi:hypothetical protein
VDERLDSGPLLVSKQRQEQSIHAAFGFVVLTEFEAAQQLLHM